MIASVSGPARARLVAWFALCFLLRAAVGIWLAVEKPSQFVGGDGTEYLDTARNIVAGRGYAISFPRLWDWECHQPKSEIPASAFPRSEVFRPPLYSIALAAVAVVCGERLWAIAVLNALLSTAAGWFLFDLARRAFSARVAEITLLIYAIYPLGVMLGARIASESLFGLCLGATAWALWRAKEDRPVTFAVVAGVCLGLATLTRSNGVFLWPFAVVWLLIYLRTHRLAMVWFTLFFTLTLLPWGVRNHAVTGKWIFLSASGSYNLWLGNNETAYRMFTARSSSEYDAMGRILLGEVVPQKVREMGPRDLAGVQEFWYGEALKFIRTKPALWLKLVLAKSVEFWRPYVRPVFFPQSYVWLSMLSTLPLFVLGGWGVALLFRHQPAFAWLLIAIGAAGMAGLVLSHVHVRLRVPFVDTFFALSAAYTLCSFRRADHSALSPATSREKSTTQTKQQ